MSWKRGWFSYPYPFFWDEFPASFGYLRQTGADLYTLSLKSDHTFPAARPEPIRPFYVFVEETVSKELSGVLDDPTGKAIDETKHEVLAERPIRIRTSGVLIADFHDIEGRFEELDPENILDEQRIRRRADLLEHLADIPLPILDLYMRPGHPDLRTVQTMLTHGSWHIIGISSKPLLNDECPVLIGAPEIEEDPYLFSFLAYLGAVPANVEVRLRDIFSLAHIADANFEAEGGDIEDLPPDDPHGGDADQFAFSEQHEVEEETPARIHRGASEMGA